MNELQQFAVACPIRSVCYHQARVFAKLGRLQGHYLGTRRGAAGIPEELTHKFPLVGLISYAAATTFHYKSEAAKVAGFPLFDRWVKRQLPEGVGIFSSYGYTVQSFRKARSIGGMTFLDAGNSHPANFWSIVAEEHARWNVKVDPYPRNWNKWGLESVELTDWVFSPSSINGEIVAIRDSQAAADANVQCYERRIAGNDFMDPDLKNSLSFATFEEKLIEHLQTVDRVGAK